MREPLGCEHRRQLMYMLLSPARVSDDPGGFLFVNTTENHQKGEKVRFFAKKIIKKFVSSEIVRKFATRNEHLRTLNFIDYEHRTNHQQVPANVAGIAENRRKDMEGSQLPHAREHGPQVHQGGNLPIG